MNFVTQEGLESFFKVTKKCLRKENLINMTSEEAIHELETEMNALKEMILFNKEFSPESDIYQLEKRAKAHYLAIEALNKENLQKVIFTYDYLGFEKCPNCLHNSLMDSNYVQFKYCPMCGQRIDWT